MMHEPLASYRLQWNARFPFAAGRQIVDYLEALGISDLYASPILHARPGSDHGYDVVEPRELNPELGGEAEFHLLLGELKKRGMGWIQDVVPNHMAYDGENAMLMDVLENGPDSRYYRFFDVRWEHESAGIHGRLLAPFLGSFYGEALEKGEIRLAYDAAGFTVNYYRLRLPLRIDSYLRVLSPGSEELRRRLPADHPEHIKFLGLLYVLRNLPGGEERQARYDQIAFVKRMLWELYSGSPEVRRHLDERLEAFNGHPGVPESFNLLDELLEEQHFRLSFWKVGTEELNYRRFFNINELITLDTANQAVFAATHELVLSFLQRWMFSGLRVDHLDGLSDPEGYLERLRAAAPDSYLVVEKILALDEELPRYLPVQGTTGYQFLNYLNGLFCYRKHHTAFDRLYRRLTGFTVPYAQLVYEKKKLIAARHMAGDVDNLASALSRVASRHRYARDFTLHGLRTALEELLAVFPIYRTYVSPRRLEEADRRTIEVSVEQARMRRPDFSHELDFVRRVLLLELDENADQEERRLWEEFLARFQQHTGPLMAKGFEDTVFYIYNRLLSLNEVGGNPDKFGVSRIEFHQLCRHRQAYWPHALNATTTHDTKRGEDVRARINVLSEIPEEWERTVREWRRINRRRAGPERHPAVPDRNDEYFLYQTLVGAWSDRSDGREELDLFRARMEEYLIKAVREAKVHTAWLAPDNEYEERCLEFLRRILAPGSAFLEAFIPFQRKVAWYGTFNSLSQTLVKIASPGVPDFYQGSELWDLRLVDPDNRRPVDYRIRRDLLAMIRAGEGEPAALARRLLEEPGDGAVKLFLISRALAARHAHPRLFGPGEYVPLEVRGRYREHILAFARRIGSEQAVAAVPRFLTFVVEPGRLPLGEEVWEDTAVVPPPEPSLFRDALTGAEAPGSAPWPVGRLLSQMPAALLIGEVSP